MIHIVQGLVFVPFLTYKYSTQWIPDEAANFVPRSNDNNSNQNASAAGALLLEMEDSETHTSTVQFNSLKLILYLVSFQLSSQSI